MDSGRSLRVLLIFENTINKGLSQGYIFRDHWTCVFGFHVFGPPTYVEILPILSISRKRKLMSIPTLAHDVQMVYQLSNVVYELSAKDELPRLSSEQLREADMDNSHQAKNSMPDLNCLPEMVPTTELSNNQYLDQTTHAINIGQKDIKQKKRKAANVKEISLEELVKYFDRTILEASRDLNIGLTLLKKRCREFGILRWPNRKIKSLDNLIRLLQKEARKRQQPNSIMVENMESMLQKEKESIKRDPVVDLQTVTKKFRQYMYKRRDGNELDKARRKPLERQTFCETKNLKVGLLAC
ncbi:hypothetical protein ACFE04_022688 [Oxalis oulophora]